MSLKGLRIDAILAVDWTIRDFEQDSANADYILHELWVVGFIVHEDDTSISLAHNVCFSKAPAMTDKYVTTIPKTNIRRRIEFVPITPEEECIDEVKENPVKRDLDRRSPEERSGGY